MESKEMRRFVGIAIFGSLLGFIIRAVDYSYQFGHIVCDIQEEGARTNLERPFPFRKAMDPALYGRFSPWFRENRQGSSPMPTLLPM